MSQKQNKATKINKATSKGARKAAAIKAERATIVPATVKATIKPSNPFRQGSNYFAIFATLAGTKGKAIDFATLKAGVKSEMGTEGWAKFTKREARNEETGKDTDAKLHQNVCVLQRKDYGEPIHAMKMRIEKTKDEKRGWLYSLIRTSK